MNYVIQGKINHGKDAPETGTTEYLWVIPEHQRKPLGGTIGTRADINEATVFRSRLAAQRHMAKARHLLSNVKMMRYYQVAIEDKENQPTKDAPKGGVGMG